MRGAHIDKYLWGIIKTDKSKRKQIAFGGNEKRTKFRKKNLLGPFSIMVINRFVFILLLLLFYLFSPDNAVCENVFGRAGDDLAKTLPSTFCTRKYSSYRHKSWLCV